jgi:L-arabinose isomerase
MNNPLTNRVAWLVAGSQPLYGPGPLRQVQTHVETMAAEWNNTRALPVRLVPQPVATTSDQITAVCRSANAEAECVGLIFWMHTFSPARMWIRGLQELAKPFLHLHTQFHRDLPWEAIDMDFMNLNQSAHGDREFGYVCTRLRKNRKVVVGHWREPAVVAAVGDWLRVAAAGDDQRTLRVARLGDTMRDVAVTEGDKVEAQIVFGYTVNGYGMGDLADRVRAVSEAEAQRQCAAYDEEYRLAPELRPGGCRRDALLEAARTELGLRALLNEIGARAFTDTFENLHGLRQLPGLAAQRLMADGYGFGAEGDWKTAALVRALKVMGAGRGGGTSFMEDYTYHLHPQRPLVLGAHMLEVCPSIAQGPLSCEIHPLAIGGKEDPVRLVFNARAGQALNATVVDLGDRFRLVVNPVEAVPPPAELPRLPVARAIWAPAPDLARAAEGWIQAGGAHHTAFSYDVSVEQLRDFAAMTGIEFVLVA